jgi:hypothetical protein
MSVLPGSFAQYKHREVPFTIWFDRDRLYWCLDTRKVSELLPPAEGRLVCGLPSAADAVFVGNRLIEAVWRANKLPKLLAPSPESPPPEESPRQEVDTSQVAISKSQMRLLQSIALLPEFSRKDLMEIGSKSRVVLAKLRDAGFIEPIREEKMRSGPPLVFYVFTPAGRAWISGRSVRNPMRSFRDLDLEAEDVKRTVNPRKKDFYIKSPNGRYVLSRDGKIVMRGTEEEVWRYIHNTHGYSVGHALKHEGYKIQPDLSLAENPRGAFYRRRHYFTDIYNALIDFHRFAQSNATRALKMYRDDIHSYYDKRVPAAVTASVIARYFPG